MKPALRIFNRRVHIYSGLALLLFVMLFAGTGLLLNRQWEFTEFWSKRQVAVTQQSFAVPLAAQGDVAAAWEALQKLGLQGEVAKTETAAADSLTIQAGRPRQNLKIEADLSTGQARVERTKVNGWASCAPCTPSSASLRLSQSAAATGG